MDFMLEAEKRPVCYFDGLNGADWHRENLSKASPSPVYAQDVSKKLQHANQETFSPHEIDTP